LENFEKKKIEKNNSYIPVSLRGFNYRL